MKNIFNETDVNEYIARIQQLSENSTPKWGKMNVASMLAHCNVTYEFVYENIHPKQNAITRLLLKTFVKNLVVSEKPYKKNSQTAPEFIMKGDKDFEKEKQRLIEFLQRTLTLGKAHFEGKSSRSFGKLTAQEWNNMFAKHLDHHLTQFGV